MFLPVEMVSLSAPKPDSRALSRSAVTMYRFWIQNGSVFRRNNTNIFYNVLVCVPRLNQLNDIALGNALQTAEKAISMPCDSQVARLADAGCSENPAHPPIQGKVIGIVEDRHFEVDLGNTQNGQREIGLLGEADLVRSDPLGRP